MRRVFVFCLLAAAACSSFSGNEPSTPTTPDPNPNDGGSTTDGATGSDATTTVDSGTAFDCDPANALLCETFERPDVYAAAEWIPMPSTGAGGGTIGIAQGFDIDGTRALVATLSGSTGGGQSPGAQHDFLLNNPQTVTLEFSMRFSASSVAYAQLMVFVLGQDPFSFEVNGSQLTMRSQVGGNPFATNVGNADTKPHRYRLSIKPMSNGSSYTLDVDEKRIAEGNYDAKAYPVTGGTANLKLQLQIGSGTSSQVEYKVAYDDIRVAQAQ